MNDKDVIQLCAMPSETASSKICSFIICTDAGLPMYGKLSRT